MSSELRVDRIIPTDGVPTGGGGDIVQTIIGTDNREQINFNTASETTLMTATITPKSTSSKILVIVTCAGVGAQSGTVWRMRLYRTVGGSRTDLPAIADESFQCSNELQGITFDGKSIRS